MAWRSGMKAVCIVDGFESIDGPCPLPLPKLGHVYSVANVEWDGVYTLLTLHEFGEDDGWEAICFRPVKTTSIEVFTQMLAPYPKKARQRA